MKIQAGEVIKLDNNKEYICFSTITDQNIDYVYLMSNFKPLEIKFAKQLNDDGKIKISIISNPEEKKMVLKLFQDANGKK